MIVARCTPAHLAQIELQPAQGHLSGEVARTADMLSHGQSFVGVVDGRVIAAAGVLEVWEGRGIAWALLSRHAGAHMVAIHRAVAGFLAQCPLPRVEAFVDADFAAGMRWMRALGFENETPTGPMRKYTPGGRDCYLFARIK